MRTFTLVLNNDRAFEVEADFFTPFLNHLRFWVKPHWYSIPRCVGIVDWTPVVAVYSSQPSADIAHELGVQL